MQAPTNSSMVTFPSLLASISLNAVSASSSWKDKTMAFRQLLVKQGHFEWAHLTLFLRVPILFEQVEKVFDDLLQLLDGDGPVVVNVKDAEDLNYSSARGVNDFMPRERRKWRFTWRRFSSADPFDIMYKTIMNSLKGRI